MIYTGTPLTVSYIEKKRPFALQFEFLDPEEILRMSIGSLTNERIYNDAGDPQFYGVNDPRMGVMNQQQICYTCKGTQVDCPGHFAHIELAKPVFHVGLLDYVRQILKCVCFNCSKLLAPTDKEKIEQIKKIKHPKHRFYNVLKASEAHTIRICQDGQGGGCDFKQPKLSKKSLQIVVEHQDDSFIQAQMQGGTQSDSKGILLPEKVLEIFKKIPIEDQEIMGIKNPQNLIIKRLAVAPPPVRPSISTGGVMRQEDDLTFAYQKILKHNNLLKLQMEKGANQTTINELRTCLQFYVATLMDNEIPGQPSHKHKNGRSLKALRARLKGKEGRLRGNLMGKRVDFSARSVITPDPNLLLDQLGVPEKIASNLTIPETVTIHNIDEMRRLVNNGPNKWPGAKYIIRHDERQIDLSMLMVRSDAHLEYGYKVERHIKNGDWVLFNRQPSLHKMSIMGHQVKVLPFNTFRLNLSVTTPYNADFDGDEMNMHVPQSYESLAEVREIMNVSSQIVAPQANKPVMGIVQDALLGIMLFTKRENFLDIDMVMNLMMWLGDNNQVSMPPPTIIKPKPLWTGKQILSLLIPNVNMIKFIDPPLKDPLTGRTKRNWNSPKDNMILIRQGQLLCGFFNKSSIGSSSGGLIHIIWKECGPIPTRDFLTNVQNVINNWLYQYGFTVGVQDAIASSLTKQQINKTLISYKKKVQRDIVKTQNGKLKCQPGKNMMESFEAQVNSRLNNARDSAGMLAFKDLDPANKMHNMVDAGSKGTNINISQIMGCVGQQNVEGKRISFGFNKRTLPHFHKFDFGPESKGFVENNYLSGLNPAEFFFHAMGGREGLIDTAVKTSETGYIQRRLMKALEDVMVKYDSTVRNSSEQVIQFLYGEDGMAGEYIEDLIIDTLKYDNKQLENKCCFLPNKSSSFEISEILSKSMETLQLNNVINSPNVQIQLLNEYKQILHDREELRYNILKNSEEYIHLPVNIPRLIFNCKEQFHLNSSDAHTNLSPTYVIEQLNALIDGLTVFPGRKYKLENQLFQEANENSTKLIKIYLRQALCAKKLIQQERFTAPAFDWLIGEIKSRFEQALVHPGEMVGSIAAHSIGEPATQMTLNTFHFAGVSSKNVTLGVPRLKEVINVAKNIQTPLVQIYLQAKRKKKEESVMKVQGLIEHTTLGQVIESSQIFYDPDPIKSIVNDDQALVNLYNEVPDQDQGNSPWVLRFILDHSKMISKQLEIGKIKERFYQSFGDQISIMNTDINADKLIMRIRFRDLNEDEGEDSIVAFLKEVEDSMMNEIPLKGFPEITKVYAKKYQEKEYDEKTQGYKTSEDNWMLETDGVALAKILPVKYVDYKRTISNDLIEILNVLGVEAVRMSLLNEFRTVLKFYGIYVNYRHLATLCDVMTHKGRLTSITRHGINRLDTGPLRKCSFEETVEILLEAAVYGETDMLKGITENIILGQLAPFGTGCFEIVLDPEMMAEHAQTALEDDLMIGETTPIIDEFERMHAYMTPFNETTPHHKPGATSEYIGVTPASQYEMSFSPGGLNNLSSPAYSSPQHYNSPPFRQGSPVYQGRFQSPIYNAYQSPIYQPQSDGQQSPQAQSPNMASGQISPNYSPTSAPINSPYQHSSTLENHAPHYSPSYGPKSTTPLSSSSGIGHSPASPGYSPIASSHRELSHYGVGSQRSANSPVYSPGVANMHNSRTSPSYSPTAPNYNIGATNNYSPSYSPSQPVTGSSRYQINRSSPNYNVSSNVYTPQSPCYNPNRTQLLDNNEGNRSSTNMYIPQSPMYNPVSPAYIVSGSGSVLSEHESNQGVVADNFEPYYNPGQNNEYKDEIETKQEQQDDNQ